jgi:hypothetical protein
MTDAPETPDELQAELKDQLLWLGRVFGQPSQLCGSLALADWRRLRAWVRGLEALVARLVRALAEGLATTAAAQGPSRPARPAWREPAAAPDTEHSDSERWTGVRARLGVDRVRAPRAATASAHAAPPEPPGFDPGFHPGFRSGRRLALRLEAVIRVAENPLRYARPLARRLAQPARERPRRRRRSRPLTPAVVRITTLGPPRRPPVLGTG